MINLNDLLDKDVMVTIACNGFSVNAVGRLSLEPPCDDDPTKISYRVRNVVFDSSAVTKWDLFPNLSIITIYRP